MRVLLLYICLIFLVSCDKSNRLIIKNANLIDIKSGESELVNIIVEDGIIKKITKDSITDRNSIDLKGNWIFPILNDMHAHLHDSVSLKMDEYRKYGVFGVRDMGVFKSDNLGFLNIYQDYKSEEYRKYGVHPVGFIYNGKACEVDEHQVIDTRSDLIEAISLIKSAKLKFFKIHNCFPRGLLDDLIKLCNENDLKVVGHIPEGIDPIKYSEYEISSIEHIDSFIRGLFSRENFPAKSFREVIDILDGPYLDSLAVNLKRNNIAITPTLVTYENFVKSAPKEQQASGYKILKRLQSYTKRFHDKGVQILVGTDYPLSGLKGGESIFREMELLIDAGIKPNEVLLMATNDSAKYLGENFQIEEGYKAKFIVLEDNPIKNLNSLRKVKSAIIDGEFILLNGSANNNLVND